MSSHSTPQYIPMRYVSICQYFCMNINRSLTYNNSDLEAIQMFITGSMHKQIGISILWNITQE